MLFTSQIAAGEMQTVTAQADHAKTHGCSVCELHRTQLILKVCFFLEHKYLSTRNVGNDYTLFSCFNGLSYMLKHLVFTAANRRSTFPPVFDRYMQSWRHANKHGIRNEIWRDLNVYQRVESKGGVIYQQLHEIIAQNNELRSEIRARTKIYEQQFKNSKLPLLFPHMQNKIGSTSIYNNTQHY